MYVFLIAYRFKKLLLMSVKLLWQLYGQLRVDFFGRFRQRLRHFNGF
ncbi:hypothetical protein CEV31_0109 [Brucella thiophenivorans]|uniref:Uncharacterized protein n=1 Tax=Brucella thiophenivorans TaxID=571255 RepID=A0A256G7L6_9HYPH|nr:hypothetical protein CEV31_0109 [Brucella thiophenivorans]